MSVRDRTRELSQAKDEVTQFYLETSIAQVNRKSIGKGGSQREFLRVFPAMRALEQGWSAAHHEDDDVLEVIESGWRHIQPQCCSGDGSVL